MHTAHGSEEMAAPHRERDVEGGLYTGNESQSVGWRLGILTSLEGLCLVRRKINFRVSTKKEGGMTWRESDCI